MIQNGIATTPSVTASETATSATIKSTEDDEIVTSVTLVLPNSRSAALSSSSTSVTMNVPAVMSTSHSSTAIKKTDLDMLTIKASPTKLSASATAIDSNSNSQTFSKLSTDAIQSNQMYSLGITDDDKNGKTVIHQKRSLLDIDNASSLSLADKLRNEANKYSDENAGRDHLSTSKIDIVNAASNEQSDKKTGSPTTPTSPTSLYQPNVVISSTSTATLNSHTNERRPSWRLKLDAGCKVTL